MSTELNDQWVSFGAESEKADIKLQRACNRCFGSQVSVRELDEQGTIAIVSPDGTVHKPGIEGKSDCGIPTSDAWWQAEEEMHG